MGKKSKRKQERKHAEDKYRAELEPPRTGPFSCQGTQVLFSGVHVCDVLPQPGIPKAVTAPQVAEALNAMLAWERTFNTQTPGSRYMRCHKCRKVINGPDQCTPIARMSLVCSACKKIDPAI